MRWLSLGVLVIGGCGRPTEDTVRADFISEHPGAAVVSAGPGEGDGEHVYYHIRFREPPDTTMREAVWAYQRTADGRWRVFQRDTAPPERRK